MENNCQHYINMFPTASKEKKLDLLSKIAENKDETIIQFLISCLADEYWPVRKNAAEIIRSLGEVVIPALS